MKLLILTLSIVFTTGTVFAQDLIKTTNYESGEKKAEYFQASNGQIDAVFYFKSGQEKETGTYIQSKKHGEWISFDRQGNKTGVGYYENGDKVGVWKFYDLEGNLTHEIDYTSGKGNLVMHNEK